jgi:hypothetical protein
MLNSHPVALPSLGCGAPVLWHSRNRGQDPASPIPCAEGEEHLPPARRANRESAASIMLPSWRNLDILIAFKRSDDNFYRKSHRRCLICLNFI